MITISASSFAQNMNIMQNLPYFLQDTTHAQFVAWQSHQYQREKGYLAFMGGQCMIHPMKDGRWHVMNGPTHRWQIVEQLDLFDWQILKAFCGLTEQEQQKMRSFLTQKCQNFKEVLLHLPQNNVTWKNQFLTHFSKAQQEWEA